MIKSPIWNFGSMLFPIMIIYEAKPPTCVGANASQITIMLTTENADQIVVENLLYIVILPVRCL
jgi:hypothetical protein